MKRFLAVIAILTIAAAGFAVWVLYDLPSIDGLGKHLNTPSVRITDRNGRLLYELLPEDGGRNAVVPLEQIPLALQQATIATEDAHFYTNPGVDLGGIIRAAWIDLHGGETLAGGSTITQQVARTLLLSPEERAQRSIRRKLRETVLAWQVARHVSKDQILALYLNQIYYGGLTYGVEAAAQTYFGKPVSELDLAECALLAGLPQTPARYNPFTDIEAAQKRQRVVLGLMVKAGFISQEQADMAAKEPLALAQQPYPLQAPHFVMMVRSQLDQLFTPEQIHASGGLTVRTTLNLDWQREAERAIQQQLTRLKNDPNAGVGYNVNNAALVALDPKNGEIVAMVGSPDYFDAEHAGALNMALSPRQPGSALKPLIYAAAFDPASPQPWTPATMILDVSTSFMTHEGRPYRPENYDGLEHGPVLARDALASSLNIPAVATLDHVGLENLFSFASRMGITTLGDPRSADLSIALGGGEVRLIDLSAAYGAFATGGYKVTPRAILDITSRDGKALYREPQAAHERVVDERVAWLISDILSDDAARAIGFGANSVLRLDRPAAVKTGTTTNFHDNWTVGYTPDLVVGVWAGNTSHEAMHEVTGLTGAAPIWAQFTRAVLAQQPKKAFLRPPGLEQVEVCSLSGLLPGDCPYKKLEWFIAGTQPTQTDTFYHPVELDAATGKLAGASTPPGQRTSVLALDLPPRAQAWARGRGLTLLSDLQTAPGAQETSERVGLSPVISLLFPAQGSVFKITASLPLSSQQIQMQAAAQPYVEDVTIYVDGTALADGGWWTLARGSHSAWAQGVTDSGEMVKSEVVEFRVD